MGWNKQMDQLWSAKGAEYQYYFEDQVAVERTRSKKPLTRAQGPQQPYSAEHRTVSLLSLSLSLSNSLSLPSLCLLSQSQIPCSLFYIQLFFVFFYLIHLIYIFVVLFLLLFSYAYNFVTSVNVFCVLRLKNNFN